MAFEVNNLCPIVQHPLEHYHHYHNVLFYL